MITATPTANAPTAQGVTRVGTPYTFGPEGQQFSMPVTITLGLTVLTTLGLMS